MPLAVLLGKAFIGMSVLFGSPIPLISIVSVACFLPFHKILRKVLKFSISDNLMSLRRKGALVYISHKKIIAYYNFYFAKELLHIYFQQPRHYMHAFNSNPYIKQYDCDSFLSKYLLLY